MSTKTIGIAINWTPRVPDRDRDCMDLRPYIRDFLKRMGLSEDKWAARADALNVKHATLHAYLNNPKKGLNFETAEAIITGMGGDLKRALPSWVPESAKAAAVPITPDFLVIGAVASETGNVTFTNKTPTASDAPFRLMFSGHPGWKLSTGSLAFLRVAGNDLEPRYSNDTLIAIRAYNPKVTLPARIEAVARGRHGHHVLRRITYGDHEAVAESLGASYGTDLRKADDLHVSHIVVGAIRRS